MFWDKIGKVVRMSGENYDFSKINLMDFEGVQCKWFIYEIRWYKEKKNHYFRDRFSRTGIKMWNWTLKTFNVEEVENGEKETRNLGQTLEPQKTLPNKKSSRLVGKNPQQKSKTKLT